MDSSEKSKHQANEKKTAELFRVLREKNRQLSHRNVTYLDYIELREEIGRLKIMKYKILNKN